MATSTISPEFLARLRAGQRDAHAELFLRHRQLVINVLHGVLGNDPDISDLVQDVFCHALQGVKHYRGDSGGLRTWLGRISVFVARGCIRRRVIRRRYAQVLSDDEQELVPASVATSEQVEALRRVQAIFEKLPERERAPLLLTLTSGLSKPEIARRCGISISTLQRRLQRARTRFHTLVARDAVLQARLTHSAVGRRARS